MIYLAANPCHLIWTSEIHQPCVSLHIGMSVTMLCFIIYTATLNQGSERGGCNPLWQAAQWDFTLLSKGHNSNSQQQCLCSLWTVCLSLQKSILEIYFDSCFETWMHLPPTGLILFLELHCPLKWLHQCFSTVKKKKRSHLFCDHCGLRPYNTTWVVNTSSPAKFSHLSLCAGSWPDTDIVRTGGGIMFHLISEMSHSPPFVSPVTQNTVV